MTYCITKRKIEKSLIDGQNKDDVSRMIKDPDNIFIKAFQKDQLYWITESNGTNRNPITKTKLFRESFMFCKQEEKQNILALN